MIVGDVVVVDHTSGVNEAHARAVVIEVYMLAGRQGWTLLFADGRFDGFSSDDCTLFGVRQVGHEATVEGYQFISATYLMRDYWNGRFAAVWR